MNRILWVAVLLLSSTLSLKAATIDDTLDQWLNQKQNVNSLMQDSAEVIVLLKKPNFKDRTGLSTSWAIHEQRLDSSSFLSESLQSLKSDVSSSSRLMYKLWSSNALVYKVDKQSLRKLKKNKKIEAILFNHPVLLDAPIRGKKDPADKKEFTYGLEMVNAAQAWKLGFHGEGVRVGILDSGIDHEHPDLLNRVVAEKDFTKDGHTGDRNGHGTHVAGTIAGGNETGTAIGVAPEAELVIAKIFDDRGSSSLATILRAMEWMMDPDGNPDTNDAPRVVNNSWGADSQFILSFRNIVQSWRRFNIFPSFAAGNAGSGWMSTGAPGRYPISFAVGAVGPETKVTGFSSRGPSFWLKRWGTRDGESTSWLGGWMPVLFKKPDIAAPGLNVYSSLPGGTYGTYSGTSMATPHVTGVVALAYQANPNLSISEMEDLIASTAVDLGSKGKDNAYGSGLIQADKLIMAASRMTLSNEARRFFVDQNPEQWDWQNP